MKIMNFRQNNKCKWIQCFGHSDDTSLQLLLTLLRLFNDLCLCFRSIASYVRIMRPTDRPSAFKIEHISILFKSRCATSDSWKSIAANQTVNFFIGPFFADVNYLSVVYFNGFHLAVCKSYALGIFGTKKRKIHNFAELMWCVFHSFYHGTSMNLSHEPKFWIIHQSTQYCTATILNIHYLFYSSWWQSRCQSLVRLEYSYIPKRKLFSSIILWT